jgi:hypothetical protein
MKLEVIHGSRSVPKAEQHALLVSVDQAKLLTTAAGTKRGDMEANIKWERVKRMLPRLVGLETRTLQRRYERALRIIVAELTLARVA